MSLSIIIPCLQSNDSLKRLLVSLVPLKKSDWEILVVFNLPSEDGESMVTKLGMRALTVGKVGVNMARNLGIASAKNSLLFFLDDDCEIVDRNLFDRHLKLHESNPHLTAIGGTYVIPDSASLVQKVYNELATDWVLKTKMPDGYNIDLLGGHVSYKKAYLPKGMAFDPSIVFGGSETEFHLRLASQGAKLLFCPDLQVRHHSANKRFSLVRKGYFQGQTYAQLPYDLSFLKSDRPSTRLQRLYGYAFHLGSRFPGRDPKGWGDLIGLVVLDLCRQTRNRIKSIVNCRRFTTFHVLLRLTLIPRAIRGSRL